MSTSEHDLPPRVTPPGYDQLDAWLREQTRAICGEEYGLSSLGQGVAVVLLAHGLEAAQKALAGYLALAPRDGTDPFLYAHDVGLWAVSQFTRHPLGPDYFAAPDNRPAGPLKVAALVLSRALTEGIDWTGTQAVADDSAVRAKELELRRERGQYLVLKKRYPKCADDLVLYGTVVQLDLSYASGTLQQWLDGQREQSA